MSAVPSPSSHASSTRSEQNEVVPDLGTALRNVDLVELGVRIRGLRLTRGMTQADVAGKDLSVAYMSRIEGGTRRPDLAMLKVIAQRLDTTAEYLVTGIEPKEADEARLSLRYAELALESGEPVEAERASAEVLANPRVARLLDIGFDAAFLHARALEVLGRLDDAVVELERLRPAAETSGRWPQAMMALSRCYREGGDLNRAIDVGEATLERLRQVTLAGMDDAVQVELTVAAAYFERGDEMHAIALCRHALERADEAGSPKARAAAYWNASVMQSRRGSHREAITLADKALAILSEGSDARNLARLRLQLGIFLLRAADGDSRQAERHLRKARRELAASSGSSVDIARCDAYLAQARLDLGDADAAVQLAESALESIGAVSPSVAADAHLVLARAAATAGEKVAVRQHYRAAASAMAAAASDRAVAQIWLEFAYLLDEVGDQNLARDSYRRAAVSSGLQPPREHRPASVRG
jgi:transcriptional regulator with XRE-family HTH domain